MPKFVVKQSSDINVNEISNISNHIGTNQSIHHNPMNYNDISMIHPQRKESNEITHTSDSNTFKILSEMKSDEFNDDIGAGEHYKSINKKIKKTIKSEIA